MVQRPRQAQGPVCTEVMRYHDAALFNGCDFLHTMAYNLPFRPPLEMAAVPDRSPFQIGPARASVSRLAHSSDVRPAAGAVPRRRPSDQRDQRGGRGRLE